MSALKRVSKWLLSVLMRSQGLHPGLYTSTCSSFAMPLFAKSCTVFQITVANVFSVLLKYFVIVLAYISYLCDLLVPVIVNWNKEASALKKREAGQLGMTDLTPNSLTQLSWWRRHLDTGYVLAWGTSWCQNIVLNKNSFLQLLQ